MADSARIAGSRLRFDQLEIDELRELASRLAAHDELIAADIERLVRQFDAHLPAASHPLEAEQLAERLTHDLRQLWLTAAAREAASVFRSPTASESRRIARHHDAFGYERDLQPESLEARCTGFFPRLSGWRHDHVVFSSGQAAMTSALLALGRYLSPSGAPLGLAHLGGYFETRTLIAALPALLSPVPASLADVWIAEPICCDGGFRQIDVCAEARRLAAAGARPRVVVLDTTLLGRKDDLDRCLDALAPLHPKAVLRITSSLKLLQGGFELANGGIVSIYALKQDADEPGLADHLRRVRTLTGAGITLADAIALEAPWFLDTEFTDGYVDAIFDHNARLARAVSAVDGRFAPVLHPSLNGGGAPFCAFQLRDAGPEDYDALENEIADEALRRSLLLQRGGSFGFRGHRFEIVRPDTGEPPFLRIAMGRRGGWSCGGIVAMMTELAAH